MAVKLMTSLNHDNAPRGVGLAVCGFALLFWPATCNAEPPVSFGRDVLPILSANCFACHGPDAAERQADLRLDLEADAKASHADGLPIDPSNPDQSTLLIRLTSTDPDVVMPPPAAHKTVTPEQIDILRRWIVEGAKWGKHWSFEPVVRPTLAENSSQHPIDQLVHARLVARGLTMSPPASPEQLVRRLSLDLTGLPPSLTVADQFAANPTPEAYATLVDDLLSSPQFGEHWARMWLDLARYADTKGYEKDLGRTVWPYRDWVVRAFNADLPFDQFTREQLAGDLLPDATQDQHIATVFHRLTMSNDEGGTDNEEFRVVAVKDRVDTTLQVWMGLTAGCAKCHTHKYDPLSQSEYYALYGLLNQTQDADRPDDFPTLEILSASERDERQRLQTRLTELRAQVQAAESAVVTAEEGVWTTGKILEATSTSGADLKIQAHGVVQVAGKSAQEDEYGLTIEVPAGKITALRLEALPEQLPDGQWGLGRNPRDPNFVISELKVEWLTEGGPQTLNFAAPRADFAQEGWPVAAALDGDLKTGWAVSPRFRERRTALFPLTEPLVFEATGKLRITMQQRYGDSLVLRRFRLLFSGADPATLGFPQDSPEQMRLREELAATSATLAQLNASIPKVPVMRELGMEQRRVTRIHRRGNFLDQGDEVAAGLPSAFHQLPGTVMLDRRALAEWLISPENPLTPRVGANRIWSRLFGQGIVETEEDFGALGSPPTHPELLDWLAAEYRDNGWSLKKLLKTIVLSETYRQSSVTTAALRELDPRNAWFSRGARYRLSAEAMRDQALAISGLLSLKQGGPPVMPPQPEGLWRSTYNGLKWINAEGEDRFRRGLYTYLKRTTPYPTMTTLDGGSGEVCQIRRIRTNTPLQALVTLNDPVFLEAAGALAERMVSAGDDADTRAAHGLRLAVIRPLRPAEVTPLLSLYRDAQVAYAADPSQAESLLKEARVTLPAGESLPAFAAWIVTANAILNLDEVLTRN